MSTTETHTHECRDCHEGFDCTGVEDWRGCYDFNGSCPDCFRKEHEQFTPYKDRPALDKGSPITWRELESGMIFRPGVGNPSTRRVRGTPMSVEANRSYTIGSEALDGTPKGGIEGCDTDMYDREYLDDGRPVYVVRIGFRYDMEAQ